MSVAASAISSPVADNPEADRRTCYTTESELHEYSSLLTYPSGCTDAYGTIRIPRHAAGSAASHWTLGIWECSLLFTKEQLEDFPVAVQTLHT